MNRVVTRLVRSSDTTSGDIDIAAVLVAVLVAAFGPLGGRFGLARPAIPF
jgi:hypothetical protein